MRSPLTLSFFAPLAPYGWPLVRFVGGSLIATHGWAKISAGVDEFAKGLGESGVPAPEIAAWMSVLAELVGGFLLAIGFLTRPAGLVVAVNMIVAVLLKHSADLALIGSGKGSPAEYPLLLATVGVGALFVGAGRCSVDAMLERRRVA